MRRAHLAPAAQAAAVAARAAAVAARAAAVAAAALLAAAGLFAGCGDDPAKPPAENRSPRIDSLRIEGLPVLPSDTLTVIVHAADDDGDSLAYAFSSSAGAFIEALGASAFWVAPDSAGLCTLEVAVADGQASAEADTIVSVLDTAPLTLAFTDLFAESNGDTVRSAPPDTFPSGWTFHARWTAQSAAAVRQIRMSWRGEPADLPGNARSFEAPVDFSGPALFSAHAVGSQGESGAPIQFAFTGNFDPRVSFVRDAEGRRTFVADGAAWTEGDTLPRRSSGYAITACVTANDPDGRVTGVQFLMDPRSGAPWTQPSADTCLDVASVGDGDHQILSRAADDAGRIGPVDELKFFVNQAPRFVLADSSSGFVQVPQPGDTLSVEDLDETGILFWAKDPDGELEYYRYRVDTHTWSLRIEPSPGPSPELPAGGLQADLPGVQIRPGTHRLSVLAADEGGRETQTDVTFTIVR